MDARDPIGWFRDRFHIPRKNGRQMIYLSGNSLGLQPKTAAAAVEREMDDWRALGVAGHFHARNPWYDYHSLLTGSIARLTGAGRDEVVVMNSLTANLHLMLATFYRPNRKRFRILTEAKSFPSDRFALESQARHHGFDPRSAIVEVAPRPGERTLRREDIGAKIRECGKKLALVHFEGVNYYTGQAHDMAFIVREAHRVGALAGFDLAHAIGNIPLALHRWDADYAVWCSYKYLNSGPGGAGGAFVHRRHGRNIRLPRFGGWWGLDPATRFRRDRDFQPMRGAEGWQLSNAPILAMAAQRAALAIFDEAGIRRLREKSILLTGYLEHLIDDAATRTAKGAIRILTPRAAGSRGCQLSVFVEKRGEELHRRFTAEGISADWREPGVIRMAPVPLYNTFEDICRAGAAFARCARAMWSGR